MLHRILASATGSLCFLQGLLGGSGVVIGRVVSPLIWVIAIVTLLITLLITTHEPPSTLWLRSFVSF